MSELWEGELVFGERFGLKFVNEGGKWLVRVVEVRRNVKTGQSQRQLTNVPFPREKSRELPLGRPEAARLVRKYLNDLGSKIIERIVERLCSPPPIEPSN
jgi:hypothetical protein